MRKHHSKRVALGAAAITVLFAGSAFTASNTVAASEAGAGDSAVSGYDVTNISYELDENSDIVGVTGVIDPDATGATARVQFQELDDEGDLVTGTWYDCDEVVGTALNCTIESGEDVEKLDNLRVVIVQ